MNVGLLAWILLAAPGARAGVAPVLKTAPWTAESDQIGGSLGGSVSSAGDVNGDGYDDVVVGDDAYENGESGEGRALVYLGSAAGLSTTPAWTWEPDVASVSFGESVASAGDVNGDGFDDLLVGAPSFAAGHTLEGRAFLFLGSATGLATTAAWTAEPNQDLALFGTSVASAGDVNGDGFDDVVVGAPYYDGAGLQFDAGRVWLYLGSAAGLETTAVWSQVWNQGMAYLGYSVASAGDVNGDGLDDVIVGAWFAGDGFQGGRAFLYLGSAATGLETTPVWTGGSTQDSAYFGRSVASAGDVNADGYADVVVGAPGLDDGEFEEGKVLVYLGSPTGLPAAADWEVVSDQTGAFFGQSVASAGDVNEDGFDDIVVGSPFYDDGEMDEGQAFVYLGSATGPSPFPAWTAQGDQTTAWFAGSVSSAGDVNGDGNSDVVVGARFYGYGGQARLYLGLCEGCPYCDVDADADGVCADLGEDCDDADPTAYPGAPELCDGKDNACLGAVPADELDGDADGWSQCAGDCDDGNAGASPDEIELCDDGADNNCDGGVDEVECDDEPPPTPPTPKGDTDDCGCAESGGAPLPGLGLVVCLACVARRRRHRIRCDGRRA